MPGAREQIRSLVLSGDTFDQPADELRELQLEAARETFTAHRERVPLLRTRATETGVEEVTGLDDLVPLLFSHTSYKSYPVSLITAGRWDRLLRWYTTVSAVEPGDVDMDGVRDIDEWTDRITAAGHRPYITSGTSGKVSFLNCDASDLSFLHDILEHLTCWPDPLRRNPPAAAICSHPRAARCAPSTASAGTPTSSPNPARRDCSPRTRCGCPS